ncbi:MAG: CHAT domain-containing protein [Armatimonas sp.]
MRLTRASLPGGSTGELKSVAQTFTRYRLPGWTAEARFLQGNHTPRTLGAIRRIARQTHRGWLECRAEQALGRLYQSEGQLPQAIPCFRRAVAALEAARTQIAPEALHVAYLSDKLSVYEDLIGALLERGRNPDIAEALSVVERAKSRLLLERLVQQEPLTAEASEARARLARAYREAHALESTDPDDPRRFRASETPLAELEQAWESALRADELQRSGESRLAGREGVRLTALQKALTKNESLLIYFATGNQLGAFVVSKKRVAVHKNLVSLDALRHSARRLRYHLQKPERETPLTRLLPNALQGGVDSVLRELFDALLRPLLPDLNHQKLVIVPHGPVHSLPLHAFLDGNCPALERWEIVTAPSAALWLALTHRSVPKTQGVLLLGIPEPNIARVANEIEAIAPVFPGARVETGNKASLETLQKTAPSLRLLHIATHARFRDDNPLFSGLKMADGWLLARICTTCRLTWSWQHCLPARRRKQLWSLAMSYSG